MNVQLEALQILRNHCVPVYQGIECQGTLLHCTEADLSLLRSLGFRISHRIGQQMVIGYKGYRVGLIA